MKNDKADRQMAPEQPPSLSAKLGVLEVAADDDDDDDDDDDEDLIIIPKDLSSKVVR